MTNSINELVDPRKAAFKSLKDCYANAKYSNLEINTILNRYSFKDVDKKLYTALVYGVIEKQITLDYIISIYSSRPIEKIDVDALFALRLGVYQLIFMDKIPEYAAVNQSVDLVSKSSKGFVNAVLRSLIRNDKHINYPSKSDIEYYLSIKYSFPKELINFFLKSYDIDTIEKLLIAFNERNNEISIRLNTLKDYNHALSQLDSYTKSDYLNYVVKTTDIKSALNRINDGYWFVQDEASSICASIVNPKENELIIDTCAAPGGKSFSMALLMNNKGELYSFDLHRNKLSLISDECEKLGLSIITTNRRDARTPDESLFSKADKVLCDVPCSGLGVIQKKPEVKYKDLEQINNLPQIQNDILKASSNYVKLGGYLIYSTCTINPDENENVVKKFINENSNFIFEDFKIANISSINGCYTFLPHITNTDGFFVAKMKRIK